MRLLRAWPKSRKLTVAVACLLLLFVATSLWLIIPPDRDRLRHEETKLVQLLGDAHATSGVGLLDRHDSIQTLFTRGLSRRDEAALLAITSAGPTLRERIAASRSRAGEPAQVFLVPGIPIPDLEKQLGRPRAKLIVNYPGIGKSVEFFSYGNLDVGVLDGKTIIVRIR
jgi:hypothetical protein